MFLFHNCNDYGLYCYFIVTLKTGLCIFVIVWLYLSSFNTLSYYYVSMLAPLLWYVNFDDFSKISFELKLYPSSGITCTFILSSSYDVGILSYHIPSTEYSSCALRNIFRVSAESVFFNPTT